MSKYHRGQFTDSKKIILHSETKPNVLDDGNKDESESDIEWNYESDQDDNDSTKQNLNILPFANLASNLTCISYQ